MKRFTSWLWPDRTISKRESRQLREEHNALVNASAELVDALKGLKAILDEYQDLNDQDCDAMCKAESALAKVKIGSQTPTITPHSSNKHAP
jgi:hypothetical protein